MEEQSIKKRKISQLLTLNKEKERVLGLFGRTLKKTKPTQKQNDLDPKTMASLLKEEIEYRAQFYSEQFDLSEIEKLLDFYSSPTGKKWATFQVDRSWRDSPEWPIKKLIKKLRKIN